jgi:hypothetical protein
VEPDDIVLVRTFNARIGFSALAIRVSPYAGPGGAQSATDTVRLPPTTKVSEYRLTVAPSV